jgi:Zn-dependent peptidase ImmA (M78 family)
VPMKVPFLREDEIERDAKALLTDFERAWSMRIAAPVPIEDIIEKHLKLGVEFDDMHRLFGVPRSKASLEPDILGAIYFDERRIVIDEALDPEENPSKEGRYRFTLAHEGGGHWRLHRHLFAKDSAQYCLLEDLTRSAVVCRSSQAKEPVEWQADFYASCLLMPRALVMQAWLERFPDGRPRVVEGSRRKVIVSMTDPKERELEAKVEEWENEQAMEQVARPFAAQFIVSPIAMRIRLEKLGLLNREAAHQSALTVGL